MKLNVDLENHSYPIYIERNAIQKVHEYNSCIKKDCELSQIQGVPENGNR